MNLIYFLSAIALLIKYRKTVFKEACASERFKYMYALSVLSFPPTKIQSLWALTTSPYPRLLTPGADRTTPTHRP